MNHPKNGDLDYLFVKYLGRFPRPFHFKQNLVHIFPCTPLAIMLKNPPWDLRSIIRDRFLYGCKISHLGKSISNDIWGLRWKPAPCSERKLHSSSNFVKIENNDNPELNLWCFSYWDSCWRYTSSHSLCRKARSGVHPFRYNSYRGPCAGLETVGHLEEGVRSV